jgi:hypothetical protein
LLTQSDLSLRLASHIAKSSSIELLAYTAETFLNRECHEALERNQAIKGQLLICDPSSDGRKLPMARASLQFIQELAHPGITVRLYRNVPLLRAIIFDRSHSYVGIYRWVPDAHFQFIGAEDNALAEVKRESIFGALWLDLYLSRFEYYWQYVSVPCEAA